VRIEKSYLSESSRGGREFLTFEGICVSIAQSQKRRQTLQRAVMAAAPSDTWGFGQTGISEVSKVSG